MDGRLVRGKIGKDAVHDQRPNDRCQAHQAGEGALQFPLMIARDLAGYNGLQRWTADAAQAIRYQEDEHHPSLCGEGKQCQPQGIQRQAQINTLFIPDLRIDDPGQPRLHASNQHTDDRQGNTYHLVAPVEPVHRKIIPVALYRLGAQINKEKADGQSADLGMLRQKKISADPKGRLAPLPVKRPAVLFAQ